jgi:hypothetical protein
MPGNRSASHQVDKCGKLYQANISSDAPALLQLSMQQLHPVSLLLGFSMYSTIQEFDLNSSGNKSCESKHVDIMAWAHSVD